MPPLLYLFTQQHNLGTAFVLRTQWRKCLCTCTYLYSCVVEKMHYNYLHSYTAAWWTQHGIAEMHCTYIYTAAHKRNCLCSYLHSSMVNEMPLYLQYIHRKCLHSYFHGGLIQQRKMPLYLFTPRHGRGNAFVHIYTTAWQRKCLCSYLHSGIVEKRENAFVLIYTTTLQRKCLKAPAGVPSVDISLLAAPRRGLSQVYRPKVSGCPMCFSDKPIKK